MHNSMRSVNRPTMHLPYRLGLIILLLTGFFAADAQTGVPQKFSYSTQITDILGNVIPNRFVRMRATLRVGSQWGPSQYCEIDTGTTNRQGIFTVVIGGGSIVSGNFSTVPWSSG